MDTIDSWRNKGLGLYFMFLYCIVFTVDVFVLIHSLI